MITNIVVHPKGATHKDNFGYFLKQDVDNGDWLFWCSHAKGWFNEVLKDVKLVPLH